jgi:hypothetical protein
VRVVAVEPHLGPLFSAPAGLTIECHTPPSKHDHHAITGYLEEQATGHAIADALSR